MTISFRTFDRYIRVITALIISGLFLLSAVPTASGRPFRVSRVPEGGRQFACALCHVSPRGGGKRNAFGNDYAEIALKAGDKYAPALGEKDSDGDGFSNDQEFAAGTHPGDPASKP